MATLKDIARLSGVSTATVSYVLNGGPKNVSAAKRERVLAAMAQLNYRPHAAARQLKGKKTGTIGVVFPHVVAAPLDNAYFAPILAGILDELTERHRTCMLFTGIDWPAAESNVSQYTDGRCDGLILIASPRGSSLVDELHRRKLKFVLIGTKAEDDLTCWVDVDNYNGAFMATQHLRQLGHERICMIQGSANATSNDERTRGYLHAMEGLAAICEAGAYQQEVAAEAVRRALTRSARPTALFCANDLIAQASFEIAAQLGLTLPQELSVIGFDDYAFAANMTPPLTTIRQPLRAIGAKAAELLLSVLADPTTAVRKAVLPVELVVRASTAAPEH